MGESDLPTKLRVYLVAVAVVGVASVAGFALFYSTDEPLGPTPGLVLCLALGLAIAEAAPGSLLSRDDTVLTLSWVFSFAIMLAGAPVAAVLLAGVISFVADVFKGSGAGRSAFNAGQVALSLLGGYAVLSGFDRGSTLLDGGTPGLAWFGIVVTAGSIVFLLNATFVGVAISLATGQEVGATLKASVRISMSTDGLLLSLAPVFVVVGQRSLLLLPLIAITVWAVFRTAAVAETHERDAHEDELTGLPNRRAFIDRGTAALQHALSIGQPITAMLIDLDGFKATNDRFGHASGDELLRQISERLMKPLPGVHLVARLGGDEFAVLTQPGVPIGKAVDIAAALRSRLLEPCELDKVTVEVGGSVGLAGAPSHGTDLLEVLAAADGAMYEAKRSELGVFVARNAASGGGARSNPSVVAEMERALENNEFQVHFQPRIELSTGLISGVEALMRWGSEGSRPELPRSFIAELERSDLTHVLNKRVLDVALGQVARWDTNGLSTRVSVNLASRAVTQGSIVDDAGLALAKHGVEPSRLELEITEKALLAGDFAASRSALGQLRELGTKVVLDDFGSGASSLTGLLMAELDAVKLDAAIVSRIDSDEVNRSVVASMVDLGRRLGMDVIAEGIETTAVMSILDSLGCPQGQGHLICRPLPPHEIEPLLSDGRIELIAESSMTTEPRLAAES